MSRKQPLPLLKARLHPDGRTRYVRVFVWATRQDFVAVTKDRQAVGLCRPFTRYRKDGRLDGIAGEVHLIRGRLGTEVVTHELFHATLAYARRVGFDMTRLDADDSINADEERLTHWHSTMCRDFVRLAYAEGLYDV